MPRLTIMQLLPALNSGGVERGTFEVAEALVKAGHRSLVVSAGGMLVAPLEATGSTHFTLPLGAKSPRVLSTVSALRDLITTQRVDIVHARSRLPAWVAWRAMRKMSPRPRFVTTLHGLNSVSRYSAIMTRGDRVIAVSDSARRYWLDHFPQLESSKVELIYRGIDPTVFAYGYQPNADKVAAFRAEAEIPDDRALLMLPGRVTESKGFDHFINLIARLMVMGHNCQGIIVGDFKPGGHYRERLTERIARLGVAQNITFTGQRQDIRDLLAMADIVYSLSRKPESFGRTTAEALALGRPVIGYNHGGVGEVLNEIFPEGQVALEDEAALVEKTLSFLKDPRQVSDRQPFLKSAMQEQTLALYQSLTSSGAT